MFVFTRPHNVKMLVSMATFNCGITIVLLSSICCGVYLPTEDSSTGSDEEDREDSNNEGEDGGEEETPPLPVSQASIVLCRVVCDHCSHYHCQTLYLK